MVVIWFVEGRAVITVNSFPEVGFLVCTYTLIQWFEVVKKKKKKIGLKDLFTGLVAEYIYILYEHRAAFCISGH